MAEKVVVHCFGLDVSNQPPHHLETAGLVLWRHVVAAPPRLKEYQAYQFHLEPLQDVRQGCLQRPFATSH